MDRQTKDLGTFFSLLIFGMTQIVDGMLNSIWIKQGGVSFPTVIAVVSISIFSLISLGIFLTSEVDEE